MIVIFLEMQWKLNDKKWIEYFFDWLRYQAKKEQKTLATMRYASFFGWYHDQSKKITFIF